jgi:hypothetical protein
MQHIGPTALAIGLIVATLSTPWSAEAAAPSAESRLRVSRSLSAVAPGSDLERAVLRLEHRSGQSRVAETEALADMTARLARMGRSIAELHALVAAMPDQPCASAAAPVESPACPPTANAGDGNGGWPWLTMFGGAGTVVLLGLLLRRRQPAGQPAASMAAEVEAAAPETIAVEPVPPVTEKPQPPAIEEVWPASVQPPVDDAITDADLSLELADVMVSMGLGGGAVQTLEGHIRQHPRQALFHWLKLLDVYRRFGQRDEFEKAAAELQHHFNIAPPEWQARRPGGPVPSLENYPHITSRLQELWPRRSCVQYLNRLLEDNRGGTRTGFAQPVVEEILLLLDLLRA